MTDAGLEPTTFSSGGAPEPATVTPLAIFNNKYYRRQLRLSTKKQPINIPSLH